MHSCSSYKTWNRLLDPVEKSFWKNVSPFEVCSINHPPNRFHHLSFMSLVEAIRTLWLIALGISSMHAMTNMVSCQVICISGIIWGFCNCHAMSIFFIVSPSKMLVMINSWVHENYYMLEAFLVCISHVGLFTLSRGVTYSCITVWCLTILTLHQAIWDSRGDLSGF